MGGGGQREGAREEGPRAPRWGFTRTRQIQTSGQQPQGGSAYGVGAGPAGPRALGHSAWEAREGKRGLLSA